jgi:hypothetical protein
MKNFKLLALAFIITTTSLFATNIEMPDIPVKQIRNQVAELFTNQPAFTVENDMIVDIIFTFNTDGEIVVLRINSKDSDVLDYVQNCMSSKKLEIPGEFNRVFRLPLKIEKK